MEFWWLAVLVWVAAIGLIVLALLLRNNRKLSVQVLFGVSMFLLVFKTVEFACYRDV